LGERPSGVTSDLWVRLGKPLGVEDAQAPQRPVRQGLVDHGLVALPLEPVALGLAEVHLADDAHVPDTLGGALVGQPPEGRDRRRRARAVHVAPIQDVHPRVGVHRVAEDRGGRGAGRDDDGVAGREPVEEEGDGGGDELLAVVVEQGVVPVGTGAAQVVDGGRARRVVHRPPSH
jgi:hypothetical protein